MKHTTNAASLAHVTLSGADHTVDLFELGEFLSSCRPGSVELGVLISHTQQGSGRYPSPGLACSLLQLAAEHRQRGAVHLCDNIARRLVAHGLEAAFAGDAERWLEAVWLAERVQLNIGEPDPDEAEATNAVVALGKPVVFQLRRTEELHVEGERADTFPRLPEGATWVFEMPAGRPQFAWPYLPMRRGLVGYAGDIGPHNAAEVVQQIITDGGNSPSRFWIDVAANVRERYDAHPGGPRPPEKDQDFGTFFSDGAACAQLANLPPGTPSEEA